MRRILKMPVRVCVGFLYTLVARDPSSICCTLTSNSPDFSNSLINFIEVDIVLKYCINTQYTVKNSSEFAELISFTKLGKSESQVSFDVVSLFTSVPLKTVKIIVANRVGDDCTLGERTILTVRELMEALDICLQSSVFVYNDVIYKQIFGCPMGFSLSPIIENMVMKEIEQTALNTYLNPPSLWVRYVDDVYAIMEKPEVEPFHDYFMLIK